MNIVQFSLDPPLNLSQFYNPDNNDRNQDLLHFEPIHIASQHNKFYNINKEIKLSPTINYDNNNSLMYYQIQIQKMRVKRARQSKSSKYRLPDLEDNSYLRIIQPSSKTVKITQRKHSQPQRLPTKSFCHFSNENEQQQKLHTKIKIRLPNIEKNQVVSSYISSLNCWTRNTSSSLFYENQ